MIPAERGLLLLGSHLGNPGRSPLTTAQLRSLTRLVRQSEKPDADRELTASDLTALGCSEAMARRILALLSEDFLLDACLRRARDAGCEPMTRISAGYPDALSQKLGDEAPACLWTKGDVTLLDRPKIALVGSRRLWPENQHFARQTGLAAAEQGFALVSGNAQGADRTAQEACLEAGGYVICIVAEELGIHPLRERVLYLSEDGFDLPFSAIRALSRNRLIHALGSRTLVAQSTLEKGGSWDGAVKNLRFGWSPLFCFADGRESTLALQQLGAGLVTEAELTDLAALQDRQTTLF